MSATKCLEPDGLIPHAATAEAVCAQLATSSKGLDEDEVGSRLLRFGKNQLPVSAPPGVVRVFLRQFKSPLIYVLLIAAAVSAALGEWSDAGFVLVVLFFNAAIGAVQEHRAEKSAEALRELAVAKARVVRGGDEHEVDGEGVVPGDVVLLEAGCKVPADLRLLPNSRLEVDESLLTGESLPVAKAASVVLPMGTSLGDRVNMAFAATLVTRGRAYGVVTATGVNTEIGRIAHGLTFEQAARPPLILRMERFARRIALAVAVSVVAVGAVAIAHGSELQEVFFLGVALAVAVIPEGLPVALTVALAMGARKMGRRGVIARRLVAVEALGSCTFIASDKTGTLTMNELTVRKLLLPDGTLCEVTGQGVAPVGEVMATGGARALAKRLCVSAALCNDGQLSEREGEWVHYGDAVDVALLAVAAKMGEQRVALELAWPRLAEIPFDAVHRYAATLHQVGDKRQVVVKGAAEQVIAMCSHMATPSGDVALEVTALEAEANRLANAGYRMLAIAAGPGLQVGGADAALAPGDLRDLVLLGFVAMDDPLRPEVPAAVAACQAAGIGVAMVTGDHPVTALAIARALGFADRSEQVVTGTALASVAAQGERALGDLVRDARVFARVEPNQKLQIVQALIRNGHFVAVTGDGANDAPALRAAHIGVAMGARGTDVARESASLILTDDNFSSIVAGVQEGRVAYGNVRKVIFLLISSGAAEVLLFVMTTVTGLPLPLLPVHLLWLNLVTNGIQDVALAFEPAEGGELSRSPRAPSEPIFDRLMIERGLLASMVMAGLAFFAFRWMLDHNWTLASAQSGVLLLMVLFENIQAGNSRSETASLLTMSPLKNRALFVGTCAALLIHIGAMYTPGIRDVLHLENVSVKQWLVSLGGALALLVVSELQKLFIRRRSPGRVGEPVGTPASNSAAP